MVSPSLYMDTTHYGTTNDYDSLSELEYYNGVGSWMGSQVQRHLHEVSFDLINMVFRARL